MTRSAGPSWFASLRRDGHLFALLTLVLTLAHAIQPLALAEANADGQAVICTMIGAEPAPDGAPVRHDRCGACIVGACGLQTAAKADVQSGPAWLPLRTVAFDLCPRTGVTASPMWPPERPAGSRAPPSVA
jgi:hypothetical protein